MLLLLCIFFCFIIKKEFSCKKVPHIYENDSKHLSDDIIFICRKKRTENRIGHKYALSEHTLDCKWLDNKLGKSQTNNADNTESDKIRRSVLDLCLGKYPVGRNNIIDRKPGNKAEDSSN